MQKENNSGLYQFFQNVTPAELARLRNKRQDTSTRDKASLLKKVLEIEEILNKLNVEISFKKKE